MDPIVQQERPSMKTPLRQAQLTPANCRRVVLTMIVLSITGCASVGVDAPDGPAQIAQTYIGQPFVDLESQLGPPQAQRVTTDETFSTWVFDRCSVIARTDSEGIVADVSWSRGCAPIAPAGRVTVQTSPGTPPAPPQASAAPASPPQTPGLLQRLLAWLRQR